MSIVGRPAFPFIGQGKARVTTQGKRKKEREIKLPEVRRSPLRVDPADSVDRGGYDVVPGSYWPLRLTCGRRAPSLSSIPSEWTVWSEGLLQKPCGGLAVQCQSTNAS